MDRKARIAVIVSLVIVLLLFASFVIAGKARSSRAKPQCNDRIDNDGDNLIDLADPGCTSKRDNDEYNPPLTYCGDGTCNGGETCETCSEDCGQCDSCSDTDGGIVYDVQGTVSGYQYSGTPFSYTDYCETTNSTTLLKEHWCDSNTWPLMADYDCANEGKTCLDGACV